ncbi:heavy-metal-associated domain-containing protein [Tautonia sociabilis]|uniref:HMA domain-containing protein n=1 Tax=Tautonia sociabilis TaxID=2080755 RepID=A0A432ME87_9BACT|nr:copper ion binding protein [Tautonia sociabilis]RUL83552.1 hypothetical protein TsocGM_21850 [Tautonia sociabilis]
MTERGQGENRGGWGTARLILIAVVALVTLAAGTHALREPLGGSKGGGVESSGPPLAATTIPVEGMSCGACAASIKQRLRSLDGVAEVEVSLEHRHARVRYSEGAVTPERLAAEINGLGYRAALPAAAGAADGPPRARDAASGERTVLIPVEGMACESCAEAIAGRLRALDGVDEVSISLMAKEARVRYVEGRITPERLAAEVAARGFTPGTPRMEGQE